MRLVVAFVVGSAALGLGAPAPHAVDPRALPGWGLYDRFCLSCHGAAGDGRGPAAPFSWGRPRAFSSGNYEWRSTSVGQPPTDDDLRTTIRHGAVGTSMPGFALRDDEIDRLIAVVKAFEPTTFATRGTPVVLGPPRPPDLARGAYLWVQLGCDRCHGERGTGDGPSAKPMTDPPYDLTGGVRRPRATDDAEARRRAAALSIATGMAGTPMPGFAGQITDADVWALADQVVAFGTHQASHDHAALDADAIATDRTAVGTWPGVDADDARLFGAAIPPQGPPPPQLAPAEASLSSRQCGRCHAKQVREWRGSIHGASASPGWVAQVDFGEQGECRRCHAPLAEQQTEPELRAEGVTCAGCHVRDWIRRGPPVISPTLLAIPGYPLEQLAIYERADFCLPCHQLPPRTAVAGKPLLNTYKEWLEGPYLRRGVQCQHCHMPNREHQWLGVHDRDTFRQGIRLDASAHRKAGAVTVLAELTNIGAGHDLPTTPTPAAWLRIELVDARATPIEGARAELRIGRDVWFDGKTWHERSDTRIPPGEHVTMARAWAGGRTAEATAARITVEVHPDDFYERFYADKLAGKLVPAARTLYDQALARARASHYVAEQREVALSSSR